MMLPARAFNKLYILVALGFLPTGNLGAQKLLDSIVTYYYTSERDSANTHKIENKFNGAGQLASYSIYTWDQDRNRWEGWAFYCEECSSSYGRYEYSYDEKGKLLVTRSFYWGYNEYRWMEGNTGRREDGYDDRGNNVSIIYSIWNKVTNQWDPNFGYEYGYDDAGHITLQAIYDWYPDPKIWHPLEKMIYTFDSIGRKTQETRQLWNDASRDWINQVKTEWYYDSPGITAEYAGYRWTLAGTTYEWREDQRHRIIKEFDAAGNLVLTTVSLKVSKTRWIPEMKEERAYNSSGQPVLSVISKGNGSLTEDFRSEWVYDTDGRLIQETLSGAQVRWPGPLPMKKKAKTIRSFDHEGNISLVTWYFWDALTKSYLFNSKDYYFYHSSATLAPVAGMDMVGIYPNPTGGILYLTGLSQPAEVKIYSVQGMLLRSVQQVENSVDLSGLPPGAYLIQVEAAGKAPHRRMIIKE